MTEELPILKGILNGVVNYHNARRCLLFIVRHHSVVFFFIFSFFMVNDFEI